MASHWAVAYVGLPYASADCAQLAERVQREQFGRELALPTERAVGLRELSRQIDDWRHRLAEPTRAPAEGDAVLMLARGRLMHIGIYCLIEGQPHVLHAMRNAGQACLHLLRDLPRQGLTVEGFYRWKTPAA